MTQENGPYESNGFEWRCEGAGEYSVLDHGYLKVKRTWGSDEEIIETARMSTDKGFLGWGPFCSKCGISMLRLFDGIVTPANYEHGDQKGCDHDAEKPGDEKLLRYLHEKGHSTPFEFAGLTIEVQAPLMVFREWHRHRVPFGYSEMSARYVQMPNLHYVPSVQRIIDSSRKSGNRQASGGGVLRIPGALENHDDRETATEIRQLIRGEQQRIYTLYEQLLSFGVSKEIARLDTPVSRYSRMRATGNLRGWLGFLTLRMAPDAQFEIRMYAEALADVLRSVFPRTMALFDGK